MLYIWLEFFLYENCKFREKNLLRLRRYRIFPNGLYFIGTPCIYERRVFIDRVSLEGKAIGSALPSVGFHFII